MEQRPATADDQDRALIKRYLEGEGNAAGGLVDRYQKPLFNVALRMLDNAQDAEDVTQTVFFNAFLKLRTYDPRYKFFSWVYRMTVNESLNLLKSRKQTTTLDDDPAIPAPEDPGGAEESAELQRRVGNALMGLKPDDRAVVILRHFVFLSYEEIADVLEIPAKTVKSRLFTARERLGLILRERVA